MLENKRVCKTCGEEKNFSEFTNKKSCSFGITHTCKMCTKNYKKLFYEKNKENYNKKNIKNYHDNKNNPKYVEVKKKWLDKNKERIVEYKKNYANKNKEEISKKAKARYIKNKEKIKNKSKERYEKLKDVAEFKEKRKIYGDKYHNEKYETDPIYRLSHIIQSSIKGCIRRGGYTKKSRTHELLGCSFESLNIHLENKFESWMSWKNHGLYNGELNYGWDIDHIIPLSSANTEEVLLKLFHYTNLQPLCSKINRDIKRNHIYSYG